MKSSPKQDIGDLRFEAGRGVSRGRAWATVLFFYGAALLLNGTAIQAEAGRRKYGWGHDAWVAGSRPLDRITRTLGAGRFRNRIERFSPDTLKDK
ncbi:MAG: hypothetical protein U1E27_04705 [Kiritimatiellia bacterium]|nr:hypothetical protein [Kiritimatiellia bacterium]